MTYDMKQILIIAPIVGSIPALIYGWKTRSWKFVIKIFAIISVLYLFVALIFGSVD